MFANIKTSIITNLVKLLYLVSYLFSLNDIVAHASRMAHRPLILLQYTETEFIDLSSLYSEI